MIGRDGRTALSVGHRNDPASDAAVGASGVDGRRHDDKHILTLRSAPQECVSKGGHTHRVRCPSFETPCCARLLRMR